LCVGETLAQREAGQTGDVISSQLAVLLDGQGPDVFGTFDSFILRVPIRQPAPVSERPKMRPTVELFGSPDPNERAELQWRLSTPVSTLLLALLAIPLSRSKPRAGRYGKLLLALGLYVLYFNLLGMARTWVEQQTLASIWWVPGLLAGITVAALTPWRRLRARFASIRHAPA
ncbi:MAG: hypothetical protein CVV17_12350, partial [Gammaproteobacteria bacterium HGW-Gammaproteobacteria-7]